MANLDRLSALDATFLHLEDDSTAHMHVASVMVFEGKAPTPQELVGHVLDRLHLVPRYRQRLAFVPFEQGRPVWTDDPHFNPLYHIRHTALPKPADETALKQLAGRIFSQRLDRSKPLWEIWLVQRMAGGRFALIAKTHHALVDGISGVDITTVLFDTAPEPALPPRAPAPWVAQPLPGAAKLLGEALLERSTVPAEMGRGVRALLRTPRKALAQLWDGVASVGATTFAGINSPAPPSPLNVDIGPHRRYTWVDADLARFKAIKDALGGTLNDVVLSAVSLALGSHLRAQGHDTDGLVLKAMVPVSVRADAERGALGNHVAAMWAPLPVGVEDPAEAYEQIHLAMDDLKHSGQAVGAQVLTNLAGFAPPTILSQAARLQARQRYFNLVVTNVPGPQFPLYLLGRRLRGLYPVVPLAQRQALGIAVMSYDGQLGFGLLADYDGLPQLESIATELRRAVDSLARAHRARHVPSRSGPRAPRPPPSAEVRLALAQMNATVGDIAANAQRIRAGIDAARAAGAELVLFGELALTGYPPEDLLLKEHFLSDARAALEELAAHARGIVAVVGYPERAQSVFNAAGVLADGVVAASYRKLLLPNYGVFDEQRYFQPGAGAGVIELGAQRVGLSICEDIWEPGPPASALALAGATLILNISASPYHAGKGIERELMLAQRARENLACVAFCALVGGQDELVFDGHSCVIDHSGRTLARARQFEQELLLCDVDLAAAGAARLRDARNRPAARGVDTRVTVLARLPAAAGRTPASLDAPSAPPPVAHAAAPPAEQATSPAGLRDAARGRDEDVMPLRTGVAELLAPEEAEVYAALCLGLRDYVRKNGFRHVVLGLSGGIDSALVACLAADALGAERVSVAIMPSPYSSAETQADARALAATLGVQVHELPIEPAMRAYADTLGAELSGHEPGLAEENLQARIRGNLLMALSNKFGWLVLTTGNKSEMSVGYSTLYGDLAGGLAVIKDVPKTLVYRLAQWRNSPAGVSAADGAVTAPIPESIIARAPSAELRPDQRDEDSLPPYPVLDSILRAHVELDQGRERLIAQGFPPDAVEQTLRLVDLAEYKRRQAPPGIKVTTRAFGRDRRMPITNAYRG